MRVTKKDGEFVVDDEPMRLSGKAAREFLAAMDRPQAPTDPEHKRFREECERAVRDRRAKEPAK